MLSLRVCSSGARRRPPLQRLRARRRRAKRCGAPQRKPAQSRVRARPRLGCVRHELPLLPVVVNDSALGAELHVLDLYGLPSEIARFPTPSFAALAEALGADGMSVVDAYDLEHLDAGSLTRPLILDCKVTTDVRSESLDFVIGEASRQ